MYYMYSSKLFPTFLHTFQIPVENKRIYVFVHMYQYMYRRQMSIPAVWVSVIIKGEVLVILSNQSITLPLFIKADVK